MLKSGKKPLDPGLIVHVDDHEHGLEEGDAPEHHHEHHGDLDHANPKSKPADREPQKWKR